MSHLHAKLLAELDRPWEVWAPKSPGEILGRIRLALRAAVELHAPISCPGFPCIHLDVHLVCKTCGSTGTYVIGAADSTARCSTIQTIARELGVDPTEGDQK